MTTGRRLSKSGERQVVKTYATESVKSEWKQEAEDAGLSLSRYLHNLIQEARALRQQGRLELGDRSHVEELEAEVERLQNRLENQRQTTPDPSRTGTLVTEPMLESALSENFKPLEQVLREVVGNEEFQDRLRTELKTELYRSADNGEVVYRRGSGWKTNETDQGGVE